MPARRRVAIVQSNYVPWRGYFDLIATVDEFILLDDAQYTRRDWRNRNRIKTPQGLRWLTIAVEVKGQYTQPIHRTRAADPLWPERHWEVIRQHYAKAAGFDDNGEFVHELYATVPGPFLTDINRHFLEGICRHLNIRTPISLSLDYGTHGVRTERLLDLCVKSGATDYVSGPAAKAYLEEEKFAEKGIGITWFEYGPYAEYVQPHPPFEAQVSVLDLLLCAGEQSSELVRARADG